MTLCKNKEEQNLIKKFFEKCSPEKEIIGLIKINDELTKVNNSKEVKEKIYKRKILILQQIIFLVLKKKNYYQT